MSAPELKPSPTAVPCDYTSEINATLRDVATAHDITLPDILNADASFSSFGFDSVSMVEFITALGETVGKEIEPEAAFNYPTIISLNAHIATCPDV